jgi:hypothetical protein
MESRKRLLLVWESCLQESSYCSLWCLLKLLLVIRHILDRSPRRRQAPLALHRVQAQNLYRRLAQLPSDGHKNSARVQNRCGRSGTGLDELSDYTLSPSVKRARAARPDLNPRTYGCPWASTGSYALLHFSESISDCATECFIPEVTAWPAGGLSQNGSVGQIG